MFRTIRSRLHLLVAVAAVAIVSAGAYSGWRASRARTETELLSNLETARAAAAAVDAWVADVVRESGILGRAVSGGRLAGPEAARLLAEAARDPGTIRDFTWVSPEGLTLVSSDPRLEGVSAADRPELLRLKAGEEVAVGDLARDALDGTPVLTVATAVRDGAGRLEGAVLATVAPDRLAARLLPGRGDDEQVTLVDRAGRVVARQPQVPLSWDDRRAASAQPLVQRALGGAEATGTARPEDGSPERLAAAVPIPSIGWAVRTSHPGAPVLGPLRREIAIGILTGALLSALALSVFSSFGGRAVASLRRLERHAEALGRGEAAGALEGPEEVVRLAGTYRRMAEDLDTARRRLEAIFEDAPVGVLVLDPADLRARFANRALLSFLDAPFRASGVAGLRIEEFVPRAAEVGLVAMLRDVAEGGERRHQDAELRHDGFARGATWWRWSVRAVASEGGVTDLVMLASDVTDQVRAREQVELDRRRLEAVLRALPAGVFVADAGGQVILANDAARRIWGSPSSLGNASVYGEDRARWAETGQPIESGDWPLQRALRTGEASSEVLLEIERFDGTRATVVNGAAPIRDAGGQVVGAVSTLLDVTEPRRALRTRDELFQLVSQDLRTPLATVTLGAATLARLPDGPGAAEQARRAAARISSAGARMARLIDDILDLARLEEGHLPVRVARCDPTDLLGEAADQLRDQAKEKGLDLCLSAMPGLPSVACDRDRILQVLGNVASNAVRATAAGAVSLAAEAQGDTVIFRVRDTGPGTPEDDLSHVFDRFHPGSGPRWREAGLDLALSRALVEAHGGRIWAESAPGEGTSVTFTLPAVADEAQADAAAGA